MNFEYQILPRFTLDQQTSENGHRVYVTSQGAFPSVTTVLKAMMGSKKLDAWKERMGDAGNQIAEQARNHGDGVHSICEKYLLGQDWKKGQMPENIRSFLKVKPFFDRSLNKIYGVEYQLYSPTLKTAGTSDLIGTWGLGGSKQYTAITDFKTCKNQLKPTDDRIIKYQYQATVYALMIEEWFRINVPYNFIMMIPNEDPPQFLIENNDKYREPVKQLFKEYADANSK